MWQICMASIATMLVPTLPPGFDDNLPTGTHRFAPTTWDEYLTAVLTLWNLLDSNINRAQVRNKGYTSRYGTPYGYMRPVQLYAYAQLVWNNPRVRTYCEVGVNGGHGTAAMLLANPELVAHSFDLAAYDYSAGAYDILSLYFGARFRVTRGDSTVTVPAFTAGQNGSSAPVSCDVILIDGDHSGRGAFADLQNMRPLAGCNATLLIDDIVDPPGHALLRAQRAGMVEVVRRDVYDTRDEIRNPCLRKRHSGDTRRECLRRWGWAMGRYVGTMACRLKRHAWT